VQLLVLLVLVGVGLGVLVLAAVEARRDAREVQVVLVGTESGGGEYRGRQGQSAGSSKVCGEGRGRGAGEAYLREMQTQVRLRRPHNTTRVDDTGRKGQGGGHKG
jgi:hypothetical protein